MSPLIFSLPVMYAVVGLSSPREIARKFSSVAWMVVSASPVPSVTVTLPSSTWTTHCPAPSMSKRYELFIPAVFSSSTVDSRPPKNSRTLAAISPAPFEWSFNNPVGRAYRVASRRAMDLDLTPEQELVRDTVREFARDRVAPVAEELDREERFPYELVEGLGALGLMGLPVPEEYGGAGGDTVAYSLAIEELTRVDSSVAITVAAHTSLGTMPILMFGSEEQKREWLPDHEDWHRPE